MEDQKGGGVMLPASFTGRARPQLRWQVSWGRLPGLWVQGRRPFRPWVSLSRNRLPDGVPQPLRRTAFGCKWGRGVVHGRRANATHIFNPSCGFTKKDYFNNCYRLEYFSYQLDGRGLVALALWPWLCGLGQQGLTSPTGLTRNNSATLWPLPDPGRRDDKRDQMGGHTVAGH